MASQWPSFTKQKAFLASTLLRIADRQEHAAEREASIQGAVALLHEARTALLQLIAELYQVRHTSPRGLDELADLVAGESAEIGELRELAMRPGSWWQHIEVLTQTQRHPAQRKLSVEQDNLIAVSAESGPDRSTSALLNTAAGLKQYIEIILERHDEW
ncbi:DUF6586 family protein [Marinobacter fonticola]|uniref:DUF6586 family protein n=1 Tax=Marinobacter fonticola TaxID=2603215 RepID=UPI0011E619D9|nr:DUF6586 family protein [Marinobacter fonticola]